MKLQALAREFPKLAACFKLEFCAIVRFIAGMKNCTRAEGITSPLVIASLLCSRQRSHPYFHIMRDTFEPAFYNSREDNHLLYMLQIDRSMRIFKNCFIRMNLTGIKLY